MQEQKVEVIPAKPKVYFSPETGKGQKKKVAAYARVSTETEEQANSYQAQVDYYTKLIQTNTAWDFVEVYTDEGISGTSTKNRDGFNRMIADAIAGKIDMILTKSCSRFARNTVTTLTTIRKLKEKGIDVFFEKENIHSTDSKGELLLTIMSSLAQDESRNISENIKWGHRQRFSKGQVYMAYKTFLGYEKGPNGKPVIVPEQAKVVRLIYRLFLNGLPLNTIARELMKKGIKSPKGKDKWPMSTVKSILTNEKYKGDCLLQKTFSEDYITKKTKRNAGELPMYYAKNTHPAIIKREIFDLVQERMKLIRKGTVISCFLSGKLFCTECGGMYGPKVIHSNDKYRKVVWQCNNKYKIRGKKCYSPNITVDAVKKAFVEMVNRLIAGKSEVSKELEDFLPRNQITIADFDDMLWYALVDKVCVEKDSELRFILRNGSEAK